MILWKFIVQTVRKGKATSFTSKCFTREKNASNDREGVALLPHMFVSLLLWSVKWYVEHISSGLFFLHMYTKKKMIFFQFFARLSFVFQAILFWFYILLIHSVPFRWRTFHEIRLSSKCSIQKSSDKRTHICVIEKHLERFLHLLCNLNTCFMIIFMYAPYIFRLLLCHKHFSFRLALFLCHIHAIKICET